MPTAPNSTWDRLLRAMRQNDPTNPDGPWSLAISGSVNLAGGGGAGGTSMVDDNPFTPGGTSITPLGGYYGGRQVGSGNAAAPALSNSAILQVEVLKQPAGGGAGFASVAVYGSPAMPVYVVGSVNIVNGGTGFASVAVYGSPANPVYNVGSVNVVNPVGILGVAGSVQITGSINPHGVFAPAGSVNVVGSVGVTPLASFTVNLGNIPTVNLGLGTVNVGNAHGIFGSVSILGSVNLGGQPIQVVGSVGATNLGGSVFSYVDARGLTTPTTWQLNFGGSGYLALVPGQGGALRAKLTGAVLITTGTVDVTFQSPSGTFLTGSLRLLPGAGFVIPPVSHWPWITSAANATLYIHATGTQNIGGALPGYIE